MKVKGDETRTALDRIPVLKLPAAKLEPSLKAVASANGERATAVENIIAQVYPEMDEKRAFRALVAPTLTRLHLARSEPPRFVLAPNGILWLALADHAKNSFLGLVVHDFARIHLGLYRDWIPPRGSLRDIARPYGRGLVDRVRGLNRILAHFRPPDAQSLGALGYRVASEDDSSQRFQGSTSTDSAATECLVKKVPEGRMLAIDLVRQEIMQCLEVTRVLASQFSVDRSLRRILKSPNSAFAPVRGAYSSIESLIVGGFACNAIIRKRVESS